MNVLLIHNDNLPSNFIAAFENRLKFDIPQSKILEKGYSFDDEVHNQLDETFKGKNFEIILLPYTLSNQNYLELSGLRIAAHIRLTPLFNHSLKPIVFIGNETSEQIARLSDFGSLLFTSGIYSIQNQDFESFKNLYDWILKNKLQISSLELQQFRDRIKVSPPSNFDSHHSISNKLTLLRWFEFIKCDDEILEVKQNLKSGLYFKYLKFENHSKEVRSETPFAVKTSTKILLIDDEAEKGWGKFFECFFKPSKQINFQFLSTDFKLKSSSEIIKEAEVKIRELEPDVILLDLRLSDADFSSNPRLSPNQLTGHRILELVKNFNRGIQVVIFTASNKIWNYESVISAGANSYVLKDEDSNVKENVENLKSIIERSSTKAAELKKVANCFLKIGEHVQNENSYTPNFKNSINNNLDIAFKLLEDHYDTSKYINYSYLQLFLIIEELLKEESFFQEGTNCYVVHEGNSYLVVKPKDLRDSSKGIISAIEFNQGHFILKECEIRNQKKYLDTNFKMSAVLIFKFGLISSGEQSWTSIYRVRNEKAAHPASGIVTIEEYSKLVNFLKFITNSQNFKPLDLSKALTQHPIKDLLGGLKEQKGW